jgi:1-acyl-sn-glycerol-3-phosphate acyltransferase
MEEEKSFSEKATNFMEYARAVPRAALAVAAMFPIILGQLTLVGATSLPVVGKKLADIVDRHEGGKVFPRLLGSLLCHIGGVKVDIEGADLLKERSKNKTPKLYVSNHVSFMDTLILLKTLGDVSFVAKSDIASWTGINKIAELGNTIFVEKGKCGAGIPPLHKGMTKVFNDNRSILGFPEGTTSDGSNIQNLKTGLLSIFHKNASDIKIEKEPLIQPLVIKFTRVAGKDVDNDPSLRSAFAWQGMPIGEHLKNIFGQSSINVEVRVLDEINPKDYKDYHQLRDVLEYSMRRGLLAANENEVCAECPQPAGACDKPQPALAR